MESMSASSALTSPELDELVQEATGHGSTGAELNGTGFSFFEYEGESKSVEVFEQVERLYRLLSRLRPVTDGGDSTWSFWIRTNRGAIEKFGDFDALKEDGDIASYDEFESLWRTEYPDPVQWHRFSLLQYDNQLFFSLKGALSFSVNLTTGIFKGVDVADIDGRMLVSKLSAAVENEAEHCVSDPDGFHRGIVGTLPLSKRFGRIRRRDIWNGAKDTARLDIEIGAAGLAQFEKMLRSLRDTEIVDAMTADDFFGYCEVCYDAVGYRALPLNASPVEKYRIMADNRDEGLSNLPGKDPQAFRDWLKNRTGGGHPWEICRGGNSTHISLHVIEREGGLQLFLEGFSMGRVVETAKMALALHARGVPFDLYKKEAMLSMLNGSDFVGIVPDDFSLGSNRRDFPAEDNISSYAHLWMINDFHPTLINKIIWYPIPKLMLRTTE